MFTENSIMNHEICQLPENNLHKYIMNNKFYAEVVNKGIPSIFHYMWQFRGSSSLLIDITSQINSLTLVKFKNRTMSQANSYLLYQLIDNNFTMTKYFNKHASTHCMTNNERIKVGQRSTSEYPTIFCTYLL